MSAAVETRRYVFNFVLQKVGNESDADDIVQVAFMRAFVHPPDDLRVFRTYVCTIARNLVCDRWNRRRHFANIEDVAIEADDAYERVDARVDLSAGFDVLNKDERELLTLTMGGASLPEVASVQGTPNGTANFRAFSARQKLRRWFEGV